MADNNNDLFTEFPAVPNEELKKDFPIQTELYERQYWIAEADKAIAMLGLKPLTIYLDMFETEVVPFEDESRQSHQRICVRECLDDTDPEMILKECLLDAFHNFRKIMQSHTERLMQGKPIRATKD